MLSQLRTQVVLTFLAPGQTKMRVDEVYLFNFALIMCFCDVQYIEILYSI